jgi:hypothetical protein
MTRPPLPELLYLPAPATCVRCGAPALVAGYCASHKNAAYRHGLAQPTRPDPDRYLLWYLASDLYPHRRGDERTPRLAVHVSQNGAAR